MLSEAFHEICDQAEEAKSHYVSLYVVHEYYGGPEEGGWWGHDNRLVAHQEFSTRAAAEAAKTKVEEKAEEWRKAARDRHGRQCQDQLDWCDARMIDDANSVFGEVDGPDDYSVVIEDTPGSQESRGPRHYE